VEHCGNLLHIHLFSWYSGTGLKGCEIYPLSIYQYISFRKLVQPWPYWYAWHFPIAQDSLIDGKWISSDTHTHTQTHNIPCYVIKFFHWSQKLLFNLLYYNLLLISSTIEGLFWWDHK